MKTIGLEIERVYDSSYANQSHIHFASKYALAHIALYESNDYYWVDFEALSLDDKPAFYRVNITFMDIASIQKELQEFENYMQGL